MRFFKQKDEPMRPSVSHPPMVVTRIYEGGGSKPEPPHDESWDDLTSLRWKAGLVEYETGITLRISTGGYREKRGSRWVAPEGYYNVRHGSSVSGPFSYGMLWRWLNGYSAAASDLERERQEQSPTRPQ